MNAKKQPVCWIIAGPNGAGKTTFALKYLPAVAHCSAFVNADLIAAGLSPLAPEKELLAASRLFLKEIAHYIEIGADFAFETTLSGRSYLQLINSLKTAGWRVELAMTRRVSTAFPRSAWEREGARGNGEGEDRLI